MGRIPIIRRMLKVLDVTLTRPYSTGARGLSDGLRETLRSANALATSSRPPLEPFKRPVSFVEGRIVYNFMKGALGRPQPGSAGIWVVDEDEFNTAFALAKSTSPDSTDHEILGFLLGKDNENKIDETEDVFVFRIEEPQAHQQEIPKKDSAGSNNQYQQGGRTSGGVGERILNWQIAITSEFVGVDGDWRSFQNLGICLFLRGKKK